MEKRLLSFAVVCLSSMFFLINLYQTFPLDENFDKIHYVGFNAHHLYYIKNISRNIPGAFELADVDRNDCVLEKCRKLYQHNPSAFWVALIFSIIPEKNHRTAFSIFNLSSAIILLVFSVYFSIKRNHLLLLIVVPYISSLITRFMMTGGIIVHIIPSILCIIGWENLKKFQENKKGHHLIVSSIANAISCFMNITFIVPVILMYMVYINDLRKNAITPLVIFMMIAPLYVIYFYQHNLCVPKEWKEIVAYEFFGDRATTGFIYSIKLTFGQSPVIPVFIILSVYLITAHILGRSKEHTIKELIISAIMLIGIFSPLIPGIVSKGLFFPRFEMVPTFIMFHVVHLKFGKKNFALIAILFGLLSGARAIETKEKVFTFKNFDYESLDTMLRKIKDLKGHSVLIEAVELTRLISEDTYLALLETEKSVAGIFWDASSLVLKNNQLMYVCGDKVIRETQPEKIKEVPRSFQLSYVLCKTVQCARFFKDLCVLEQSCSLRSMPDISLRFFRCEN